MAKLNFILQAKGGVGKSTVAKLLAQYHISKNRKVYCFDTDPKNPSLVKHDALKVTYSNIMVDNEVDLTALSEWIDSLVGVHGPDDICVIDCGASNFEAMVRELVNIDFLNICSGTGDQMFIHTVLMQGPDIVDQLLGLQDLLEMFKGAEFVVWKNEYLQSLYLKGVKPEESVFFVERKQILNKIITIPKNTSAPLRELLADIYNSHQLFDEVLGTKQFPIVQRSLVHRYWREQKLEIERGLGDGESQNEADQPEGNA